MNADRNLETNRDANREPRRITHVLERTSCKHDYAFAGSPMDE